MVSSNGSRIGASSQRKKWAPGHSVRQQFESTRVVPAAPEEPAPPPSPTANSRMERLAILCALRERGIISDQAFTAQRNLLLGYQPLMLPAPAAPEPEHPRKRKSRRFWVLGLAAVVSALAAGSCVWLAGRWTDLFPAVASVASISSRSGAGANGESVYPIGAAFHLGDYTCTVTGWTTATTLGSDADRLTAGDASTFLIVHFTMRNDTSRARPVLADDFTLVDANGVRHHVSDAATEALTSTRPNENGAVIREVQADSSDPFDIAYEIPLASVKGALKLVIPQRGLFTAGKVVVNLTPSPSA